MRTAAYLGLGAAFLLSASAFVIAPASAQKILPQPAAQPAHIVKVCDGDGADSDERLRLERELRRERCEAARRECAGRHGPDGGEFQECVKRTGCGQ